MWFYGVPKVGSWKEFLNELHLNITTNNKFLALVLLVYFKIDKSGIVNIVAAPLLLDLMSMFITQKYWGAQVSIYYCYFVGQKLKHLETTVLVNALIPWKCKTGFTVNNDTDITADSC